MMVGKAANKYFQDNKPWELIKSDKEKCAVVLYNLLIQVKDLAILLYPYTPSTSEKIFGMLNLKKKNWDDLGELSLKAGSELEEPEILFKKIKEKKDSSLIDVKSKTSQEEKIKFSDLDIEVGEILSVSKHPDADKLYLEVVELGDGKKQIVSGIADYYSMDELKGKKVVVLKNLKPAKIRGAVSQGMVLTAESKEGELEVLEFKENKIGDNVHLEGERSKPKKEINIKEFLALDSIVKDNGILSEGKKWFVEGKEIRTKKIKDGKIR